MHVQQNKRHNVFNTMVTDLLKISSTSTKCTTCFWFFKSVHAAHFCNSFDFSKDYFQYIELLKWTTKMFFLISCYLSCSVNVIHYFLFLSFFLFFFLFLIRLHELMCENETNIKNWRKLGVIILRSTTHQ